MRVLIFAIAFATSVLGQVSLRPDSEQGCRVSQTSFEGWQAQQISNRWVRLTIVPQLGGRLMQVSFSGHDFLFVNPKYKGKYVSPSQAGNSWINYGGDKIWPLPEGDQDDHHWVLKSDVLDDGEYSARVTTDAGRCSVFLEGPPDPVTGLQYSRQISLGTDTPAISFHAVMKNVANHPIVWSVQSVSQYNLADHTNADTFNRTFYAFTPVNPHSSYFSSFQVRAGLADDPSFSIKDGLFKLHWLYLENEVWLDSPAGWLAVVDGDTRFAIIERFKYQPHAEYPGNATVIFYKNGAALGIDDNLLPRLSPTSTETTPYYMEAELNSPLVSLQPGETYAFDTEWFPTRSTAAFAGATPAGVVNTHAHLVSEASHQLLAGAFGVFYPGELHALYFNAAGLELGHAIVAQANPSELLELRAEITLPPGTAKVSLHLIDRKGTDRGVLDETDAKPPSGASA